MQSISITYYLLIIILALWVWPLCEASPAKNKKTFHYDLTPLSQSLFRGVASDEAHFVQTSLRKPRSTSSSKSTCIPNAPLCRCRRKKAVICSKTNCLQTLPTSNMSESQGSLIHSIVVTRQPEFTMIKFKELQILRNIRTIRFFRNGISAIHSQAFTWTPNLERLDLHQNNLRSFPRAIQQLQKLRILNLGGNKITSIPTGTFDNHKHLEQLVLRRNEFETFPGFLPRGLVKLSIGLNLLSGTGDIRYLKLLRILRLDSNRFMDIQSNLFPTSLRELSMCNNQLTSRSYLSLENLKELRRLRLAGNTNLQWISKHTFFHTASKLREIDLRRSKVLQLEADAFSCFPRLQVLELEGNNLTEYNSDWFAYSKKIRQVSMSGNHWRCNCNFVKGLNDFTSAVEKVIGLQKKGGITRQDIRMQEFSNDFKDILCHSLTDDLDLKQNWRTEINHNFSSINPTLCKSDISQWNFKISSCARNLAHFPPSKSAITKNTTINEAKIKVTTTKRPAATTTATTRKTITTTTTRKPTTTTTTRKPTTTTTLTTKKPTTATTTATKKPTTTTTTTTIKKPTTTITTTTIKKPTTTITMRDATHIFKNSFERACTDDGIECILPFEYDGETYFNCIPHAYYTSATWCFTNVVTSDWDYCAPCPVA